MVDLKLTRRLAHFVPLSLLKQIAIGGTDTGPGYLTSEQRAAIKVMSLFTRSRLSVQPVEQGAWDAVILLGEKGGWEENGLEPPSKKTAKRKGDVVEREERNANAKQRRVAKVEVNPGGPRRSSRMKG